jgi:predicted transport protein
METDKAIQTMMDNLQKNTGKSLTEWIDLLKKQGFSKHGEMMSWLKGDHGLTHGFANMIALKARGADAGSANNPEDLIPLQYKGKESLQPIYEQLRAFLQSLGGDVEFAPRNAYVSVRRKKQFALLQPATKTRFDLGIQLKGQEATGKLQAVAGANAMCSHKIALSGVQDLDEEVYTWLKKAYELAG